MDNKYGYKICYKQFNKTKLKIYCLCNTYDLALWLVRYYTANNTCDNKTKKLLHNAEWYVIPVKTILEYKWLWRGCPFN